MNTRFDYIPADTTTQLEIENFKHWATGIEHSIEKIGGKSSARAKAVALTKLEECSQWFRSALLAHQHDRDVIREKVELEERIEG